MRWGQRRVKSVGEARALTLAVSRAFGIYPFARAGLPRMFLTVYSVALFSVFAYSYYRSVVDLYYLRDPGWYSNTFNRFNSYCSFTLHFVNGVVSCFTSILGVSRLKQVISNINVSENTLSKMKGPVLYRKLVYDSYSIGPIVLVLASCLVDVLMSLSGLKAIDKWQTVLSYFSIGVTFATKSQCLTVVRAVTDNFGAVKGRLSKSGPEPKPDVKEYLLKLQSVLVDSSRRTDKSYALHMYVSTGNIFGLATLGLYQLYKNITIIKEDYVIGFMIVVCLEVILLGFEMFGTVYVLQQNVRKAQEFNEALYKLMVTDKTGEVSKNEKFLVHIAMKRTVEFSACGFFTLDYNLIQSMIGAAATFLVILIQFDISHQTSLGSCSGRN